MRENSCERITISFGWTSDWMKKWRNFLSQSCSVESAKPITFRHSNEKRSNQTKYNVLGPLHDPVTWYKIIYTGELVAQRDLQNKARRRAYCHAQ